jgi:hypothetical protein
VTLRLSSMPKEQIAAHLAGFGRYVASSLVLRDGGLVERAGRTTQVIGVAIEPAYDGDRCELVLRGVAELLDGLIFRRHTIADAQGRVLAEPRPDDSSDEASADDELHPPTPERVARRALVLAAVAIRGLIESAPNDDEAKDLHARILPWLRAIGADAELEPHETRILETPLGAAPPRDIVNASWRSEGLAVLAWALGAAELPPHDTFVETRAVADAIGFLAPAPRVLAEPKMRSREELEWMLGRLLGLHWRMRDFGLHAHAVDFKKFARENWFGGFDPAGIPFAGDDLAIDGVAIVEADSQSVRRTSSIALERHLAINWLSGFDVTYSEVDTST